MADVTPTVEMQLGATLYAGDGSILYDPRGDRLLTPAGWTDVTADVRLNPAWRTSQGILGSSATDRVATGGRFTFQMDNSANNSGGLLGYYSPDSASCRIGFDLGTLVRLKLVSGATTLYAFYGRIKSIKPASMQRGERYTDVVVGDFMEQLAIKKLRRIPVQLSKRNDELVQTILDNMPIQPIATSYAVGPDTFATALNAEEDERAFGNAVLQKCMLSGLDYAYVKGDATGGETFVYESRQTRALNTTPKATLSDTMSGLEVMRDASNIWNLVNVVAYPDKYDASAVVLYSSPTEIAINAGQSNTFTARFRDPSGLSQRTSVYPGSEVTPVADTDYKMSSVTNNGGNDLNSSLGIFVDWGGNTAEVTLTNTGSQTGYVNLFQLRGRGIYHYDPVTVTRSDEGSQYTHGEKALNYNVPYQSSANVAADFANVLLSRWSQPVTVINSVSFIANRSASLMTAALTCTVGDRVTLTETATGINGDYIINAVEYSVEAGNILRVTWIVEPAGSSVFWILETSALDTSAALGF